jgi:hypothetical protein
MPESHANFSDVSTLLVMWAVGGRASKLRIYLRAGYKRWFVERARVRGLPVGIVPQSYRYEDETPHGWRLVVAASTICYIWLSSGRKAQDVEMGRYRRQSSVPLAMIRGESVGHSADVKQVEEQE